MSFKISLERMKKSTKPGFRAKAKNIPYSWSISSWSSNTEDPLSGRQGSTTRIFKEKTKNMLSPVLPDRFVAYLCRLIYFDLFGCCK